MNKDKLIVVGDYIELFNCITGQNLPCRPIYQSTGLHKHISKRHPEVLHLLSQIPKIIKHPDYIGKHPDESASLEFVKDIGDDIMVCIKLEPHQNYFYVSSMFKISKGKILNRICSGRLKKINEASD